MAEPQVSPSETGIIAVLWNAATSSWEKQRTPTKFVPIGGVSVTEPTVAAKAELIAWKPASGKRFRLMGYLIDGAGASAATIFQFLDGKAGTAFWSGTLTASSVTPNAVLLPGNGYLSTAANNELVFKPVGESIPVGTVFGTEE